MPERLERAGLRDVEDERRARTVVEADPREGIARFLGQRHVLRVERAGDEGVEQWSVASFPDLDHDRLVRRAR